MRLFCSGLIVLEILTHTATDVSSVFNQQDFVMYTIYL